MKSSSGPWFVYLIRRPDGGFLTGITPDPAIRIHPHTGGRRLFPRRFGRVRITFGKPPSVDEGADPEDVARRFESAIRDLS